MKAKKITSVNTFFGKGLPFLTLKETYIPAWKTDNREMLANLIRTHDLIIKSTFFDKPSTYKATYTIIGMHIGPPWTPDRYEEIDNCIMRFLGKHNYEYPN